AGESGVGGAADDITIDPPGGGVPGSGPAGWAGAGRCVGAGGVPIPVTALADGARGWPGGWGMPSLRAAAPNGKGFGADVTIDEIGGPPVAGVPLGTIPTAR